MLEKDYISVSTVSNNFVKEVKEKLYISKYSILLIGINFRPYSMSLLLSKVYSLFLVNLLH